jgi:hypothetical protein
MALDFPTSPTLNEIYTYGGRSWQWNGTAWDVYNASSGLTQYVSKLNGLCGSINIAAGTSISVTPSGNTLTIAYTGGGGGGGATGNTGATGATGPQGNTGATGATPSSYVSSFNGLTGAVTGLTAGSIGGTYGSILYKSASGISGTEYFTISSSGAHTNNVISFVGPTDESVFNTNTGIKINRWMNDLGLDEGGGPIIYADGYDPFNSGAASLYLAARDGSDSDISSSVKIGTYNSGTWVDIASFNSVPTADNYFYCNGIGQFQSGSYLLNKGSLSFFDTGNINYINLSFNGLTLPA